MEYRKLGKSGLRVSALSFGSWVTFAKQLDNSSGAECMKYAYDNGVNFFDNAEVYENGASEKVMGEILKEMNWPRDSYCVSSKVFWGGDLPTQKGLSSKHIRDACDAALKRLHVDYLDLYFCHRPDPFTPVEETVRAMDNLVKQGKILYWGTSEWSGEQLMEAYGVAREYGLTPPTMEQPQYNMFEREKMEKNYLRLFSEKGMGTTIWSPLASGLLTGKYADGIPEGSRAALAGYEWLREKFESPEYKDRIEKVKKLDPIAKDLGGTLSQLAVAWCLKNENVSTVILGASRKPQLEDTMDSMKVYEKLDDSIMTAIEEILDNRPEPEPVFIS